MKTQCCIVRGDSSCGIRFVVIRIFGKRYAINPIVLFVVHEVTQIDLELLNGTFTLSIGLRMICHQWCLFDAANRIEGFDEVSNKLRSTIACDGGGNSKESNPVVN